MDPTYAERRRLLLTGMLTALAADDDDDYCAHYDALVEIERDAGEFDDHDDPRKDDEDDFSVPEAAGDGADPPDHTRRASPSP